MSKRCLIIRYGAIGDMVVITPVLKRLKELGYYIIVNTTHRGKEVLFNNPNVDELLEHDDKMPIDKLEKHWKEMQDTIPHDKFINFTQSLECNVVAHPISPFYIAPKKKRIELYNRNYYDATNEWAGVEGCQKTPELYFTDKEIEESKKHIKYKQDRGNEL